MYPIYTIHVYIYYCVEMKTGSTMLKVVIGVTLCLYLRTVVGEEFQLYVSQNKSTWGSANASCDNGILGSPLQVKYTANDWLNLDMKEATWIAGYQKKSPFFWSLGCFSKVSIENSNVFSDGLSFTKCVEFCDRRSTTQYIGLKGNNCSCISKVEEEKYGGCVLRCSGSRDDLCGSDLYFTVHKKWKPDDTRPLGSSYYPNQTDFDCVSVADYRTSSGKRKFGWIFTNCSVVMAGICKVNNTYIELTGTKGSWHTIREKCLDMNATLPKFTIGDEARIRSLGIFSVGIQYWTGLHRETVNVYTQALPRSPPRFCLAALQTATGQVSEVPKNCSEDLRSVCSTGKSDLMTAREEDTGMFDQRDSTDTGSVVGGIIGALFVVSLVVVIAVCAKKRKHKGATERTEYRAPRVSYKNNEECSQDSEIVENQRNTLDQGKSPKKPVRRTKSRKDGAEGTSYENIVLGFEDPNVLSQLLSNAESKASSSYSQNYDTANTVNAEVDRNDAIFNKPENEYDVTER